MGENAVGAAAIRDDFRVVGKLGEAGFEFLERYGYRSRDVPSRVFLDRPYVDDRRGAGPRRSNSSWRVSCSVSSVASSPCGLARRRPGGCLQLGAALSRPNDGAALVRLGITARQNVLPAQASRPPGCGLWRSPPKESSRVGGSY